MNRRQALFSLSSLVATLSVAPKLGAKEIHGFPLDVKLDPESVPVPARVGGYSVLTDITTRKNLVAIFDRLIPADSLGPSAIDEGALEFLDSQLAGDYGSGAALYLEGPLRPENEEKLMGSPQFITSPRERYLTGLKALELWAQANHKDSLHTLNAVQIDAFLTDMEAGKIDLGPEVNSQAFFELMLQNVRESYLSDPLYGGNKTMAGWKMIGFPGARYDYRQYVERRGENLKLIPVSLIPDN